MESKTQLPADRDGKIEMSEMAAAFAVIESAEQARNGGLFFDEDAKKWKIR